MTSETGYSELYSPEWPSVSLLPTVLILEVATIHSNKHFPRAYYVPSYRRGSGHSLKRLQKQEIPSYKERRMKVTADQIGA